jgi:hypothetical protein
MIIRITQAHIDRGVRHDGTACPIALAIIDSVPGLCWVHVSVSRILITMWGYWRPWNTDHTAETAQFRLDFNRGIPVAPFQFDFPTDDLPSPRPADPWRPARRRKFDLPTDDLPPPRPAGCVVG